ncbi:MAG: thioredoxin-like domain-containing protein [Kiritimatiellia bacterium]
MNTFKYITRLFFCTTLLLAASASKAEEGADNTNVVRTWTSATGDKIEAAYEKTLYGLIHLKKADGTTIKIKKPALSAEDQKFIDDLAGSVVTKAVGVQKSEPLPKAPDAIYEFFGDKLRTAKNKPVPVDTLTDKVVGIYFSAHWCPPCRAFTPQLVKFYNKLQADGKPFEIVFVSSDRSKEAMYDYMKEMDMKWNALPYGDKHRELLAKKFNVSGIPKLVILNAKGELITENGRNYVNGEDTAIFEKWAAGKER